MTDLEQRLAQRMREVEERVAAETAMLKAEALLYNRDRRERIATAAMAGLLAKYGESSQYHLAADAAAAAVVYADALIAELDKEMQP